MITTYFEIVKDTNSKGEQIFVVKGYEGKKKIVGEFFYMEDMARFFVESFMQSKSKLWAHAPSATLN